MHLSLISEKNHINYLYKIDGMHNKCIDLNGNLATMTFSLQVEHN